MFSLAVSRKEYGKECRSRAQGFEAMTRICLFLFPLIWLAASIGAAAQPVRPWVELAPGGVLSVRTVVAPEAACPAVTADGAPVAITPRAAPDAAFPIRVCEAHVPQADVAAEPRRDEAAGPAGADQPHRRDRRYRLPHRPVLDAGLPRPEGLAVSGDRRRRRRPASRPGDPCRRLLLSRERVPGGAPRLRRQPARRQLGGMAGRFSRPGGAAAGRRAVGHGARQSRIMRPRRTGLVPPA